MPILVGDDPDGLSLTPDGSGGLVLNETSNESLVRGICGSLIRPVQMVTGTSGQE